MIIFNLDENFEPCGVGCDFETFIFPGGEVHVKISECILDEIKECPVTITARIGSSDDLMKLLLLTDALKRAGAWSISLIMPYLPYARQDRVMVPGEPLSIKVFANIINDQMYHQVVCFDAHSDVGPALIDNYVGITNHKFVTEVLKDKKDYYIVSPDAGAEKKVLKVVQAVNYQDEIVYCSKIREVSTGKILRADVNGFSNLHNKDCYIIDDICDGGGTFILLAKALKKLNAGKVNLIVSHGIFSKGLPLEGIDEVYCTNSFQDAENCKQYKLTENGLLS